MFIFDVDQAGRVDRFSLDRYIALLKEDWFEPLILSSQSATCSFGLFFYSIASHHGLVYSCREKENSFDEHVGKYSK